MTKTSLVPMERIEQTILLIRGHKVMLDSDLARLYKVTTKRLNEQMRRNRSRFPKDFMFQLNEEEFENLKSQYVTSSLRSQFATSKDQRGGRRYLPYVFTEHGAMMLASVLNSPLAIETSIHVVRAFVRLRQLLASHAELSRKLDALEAKYADHDEKIVLIFEAIRKLMTPVKPNNRRKIGFRVR